jgi:hypothetical protein
MNQTEPDAGQTAFCPSDEWIEAFENQASDELMDNLEGYAAMRARLVVRAGGVADEFYVREVRLEALEDTWRGVVAWDPGQKSLEDHLRDVIRFRSRHHIARARRFRRQSLDEPGRTLAETEASLAARCAHGEDEAAAVAASALEELREAAVEDADVIAMIEAFAQDATKKVDVMRVTGMSSKQYEAARKRMHRLVKQLSPELRAAAARIRA